ncbi:MAG: hypothetical protein ABI766_00465 [Gemmatimonadales bacterium]
MRVALVILAAAALAAFTYLYLERAGARGWAAATCRAIAWSAIGLLLLNAGCPVAGPSLRPLVLLDGSLSMTAAGGRWAEAKDSAARWGEVRLFGDERGPTDSTPSRGRSLLAPSLLAASASPRRVIVVTDGEIEDVPDIPADILARTTVRLFARAPAFDVALTRLSGPSRVTAGDSIALDIEIEISGGTAPDTVSVEMTLAKKRLALRRVRITDGVGKGRIVVPSSAVGPGDHLLGVSLVGVTDAEPRTDSRLHLVTVAPTPGVVLLAAPADWDSRFLYRTLREVAQLPVQGFVRLDPDRWRSMSDLRVVTAEQVRRSARRADLLILKGGVESLAEGTTARGILAWPAPEAADAQLTGDWYLAADGSSPLGGAFVGQPVDSFPPAIQLTPLETGPADWIALSARLGRRGAPRPAVFGRDEGRTRRVVVAVDGLWRWAFRGGSSEESYRSWVAATASWLLGGVDTVQGLARAIRPVVPNGRPLVFDWTGSGPAIPLAIAWSGAGASGTDTLTFDGSGRATLWRRPGAYRYRLARGGSGAVAVEEYSDELRPHRVTLKGRESAAPTPTGQQSARDWPWLFVFCILALAGEWLARRRLGLR